MPPALERLLASPSALRVLRSIVNAPEFPSTCLPTVACCRATGQRRNHSKNSQSAERQKWRRWHESAQNSSELEKATHNHSYSRSTVSLASDNDNISKEADAGGGEEKHDDDIAAATATTTAVATWTKTLARQERLHGLNGIRAVWSARQRYEYNLPTDDSLDARFLWGTFIKHPGLVDSVIDHAAQLLRETGQTYPHLYELVIGYWLSGKSSKKETQEALRYHHRMLVKLHLRELPLRNLARFARSRFKPWTHGYFMEIYRNSNERNIYDEIVPPLCEQRNITMARRWHTLCSFRGDLPSPSVASHPLVQIFTAEASIISDPNLNFKTPSTSRGTRVKTPRYNEELMRRLLGRDTAPVRFDDSFCARMFATRAFPPESIIRGLAMVGVNEIGPQALLTMALRTVPMHELPKRFEELRAAGIALQGCVFSLALEKFAMDGKWRLVRSILDSDQHPDVFGDMQVQKKLLDYYLDEGDWVQAHRTLAILSLFHNDSGNESWNLLLQTCVKRFDTRQVLQVLQNMRENGVLATPETMVMIKGILRRRQRGRKPITATGSGFDDLRFVTRVFIMTLESGISQIPPIAWREIIRRYGMLGRFRELRRLMFWLLCWYAPRGGTQFAKLPKSPFLDAATEKLRASYPERNHYFYFPAVETQVNKLHPVRQLFPPSFLQSLVTWGFRAGLLPNGSWEQSMFSTIAAKKHYRHRFRRKGILKRLDWSIGLKTVVQLRDLGVCVRSSTVTKALQMQFINLFGPRRSSKKENRTMEDVNVIPYAEYVREVNKIWGSPLFCEPHLLGKSKSYAMLWHPRLPRRVQRRSQEYPWRKESLGLYWQDHKTEKTNNEPAMDE